MAKPELPFRMMGIPPHVDDVDFVNGPLDKQRLRVPPRARNCEVKLPIGDKDVYYKPVWKGKDFAYVYSHWADRTD